MERSKAKTLTTAHNKANYDPKHNKVIFDALMTGEATIFGVETSCHIILDNTPWQRRHTATIERVRAPRESHGHDDASGKKSDRTGYEVE